jgi:chemotaxis protein MotB
VPKKAHHEEHENLEAWVIPYADLLTLLLAMFLALYATSNSDLQKVKEFAAAFRSSGGHDKAVVDPGIKDGANGDDLLAMGGAALLDGSGLSYAQSQVIAALREAIQTPAEKALAEQQAQQSAKQAEQQQLAAAEAQIKQALAGTGLENQVRFQQNSRGLQVTLLTDGVLFSTGQADLAAQAGQLIGTLGDAIKKVDNEIEITGHTDSVGSDRSNVALSTQRAASVYSYLVEKLAIPSNRLLVSGRGSSQPIADNSTEAGRAKNRRVEITILSKSLTAQSLTSDGAVPTGAAADPVAQAGDGTHG